MGVDPGTVARWERGERDPDGVPLGRVKVFLAGHGGEAVSRTA